MTGNGYDDEQIRFREQHRGGLVWETVRVRPNAPEVAARKRDGWIAKLRQSLTPQQQDAMEEIEAGYRAIVAGVGFRTFDPAKPAGRGTGGESERQAQLVSDYFAWGQELQRRNLSHAMVMAMVVEGLSARQTARAYRVRSGMPMRNLRAALDVFCSLRGWPV